MKQQKRGFQKSNILSPLQKIGVPNETKSNNQLRNQSKSNIQEILAGQNVQQASGNNIFNNNENKKFD